MHGGDLIASVLQAQGVSHLFSLCGGHISPILVGCKKAGIRVVDVRDEANAVFAAEATARLTGIPGVAAVTAGPGVTNTMTAVKNAQLANSPVIIIGGAAPTVLRGRGALQDIDQLSLMRSAVKWATRIKRVRDIIPTLERAFAIAQDGVPGPVFVECALDLLYDQEIVGDMYLKKAEGKGIANKLLAMYLRRHIARLFAGKDSCTASEPPAPPKYRFEAALLEKLTAKIRKAERPVMVLGTQVVHETQEVDALVQSIEALGIPVYLSGMSRGLLGKGHPLQRRHKRRNALKEADLVILAGVPCDFRLDYGGHIRPGTFLISINRDKKAMKLNRRPDMGLNTDPARLLRAVAKLMEGEPQRWPDWKAQLQ
jgi:acetolactate synthase-like protein